MEREQGIKLMQDLVDPEARKVLESTDFSKVTDTVVAESGAALVSLVGRVLVEALLPLIDP